MSEQQEIMIFVGHKAAKKKSRSFFAYFLLTHYIEKGREIVLQLGSLTQLVEYLPFKQRVARSSRARPTN